MKILCLHGMGGSARIFEAQTSQITRLLQRDGHDFVYVDGIVPCKPETELGAVYPPPYLAYAITASEAEITAAHDFLEDVLEDEGPFDGVLAFSQGCQLAASFMFEQQKIDPDNIPFRWAAFIGSPMPHYADGRVARDARLEIPTLHVIGNKDRFAAESRKLASMHSNPLDSIVVEHQEGHVVPRDPRVNYTIANAVLRLIAMVSVAAC